MAQKRLQRILLVNDDGIDAPGIKLLEGVAQQLADEVWVVAPATDKSGVANSVSLGSLSGWSNVGNAGSLSMVLRLIVSRWLSGN